jgi:hypothetical protein
MEMVQEIATNINQNYNIFLILYFTINHQLIK